MKARYSAQGRPTKGWVFPTKVRTGHLGWWGYRNRHVKALEKISKAHEADSTVLMVSYFEPYCLRHKALTWLVPHTDVYTLAKIAGPASITMRMRYIYPQAEAVEKALRNLAERVPTE